MRAILVFLVAIALCVWHFMGARAVAHGPGVIAPDDPRQTKLDDAAALPDRDFTLHPRARFEAEVRVLSRESYELGKLASLVPLDIAVGWGRMSDSSVLAKLKITQGNRFYYWHYDDEPPIPREEIETHSANWHIVPANESVWDAVKDVKVGEIVHLAGQLVDIEGPEFGQMRTSLTRSDTGPGACEILYLQSAAISRH